MKKNLFAALYRPGLLAPVALSLAFVALSASHTQAATIELADGRTMQGEILAGQTTDAVLALRVFRTGGVVLVKWEHVLPERAQALRVEYGIEVPEDEQVTVTGHVVTLTMNGVQMRGVVLNLDAWNAGAAALELKTPTGVQTYERSRVANVTAVEMNAVEAYTVPELYQRQLAESPPQTAADQFALGDFCQRIHDYAHAKEHYEAARADADFGETPDGKSLEARLRNVDILLRAEGARKMVEAISRSMYQRKWNLALEQLITMDEEVQDEQIRSAIGFDRLQSRVVRGRDDFFKAKVQITVYRAMDRLIDAKVREKKPLRRDADAAPGAAMRGTLAGARSWAVRELPTELWDKVGRDLGLETEEVDRYWADRTGRKVQVANYGTGSFIVVKRATLPGAGKSRRRPPGANRRRGDGGGGSGASKAAKPKTDEEWWDSVKSSEKAHWIEAYFAENSGIFEKIRSDESRLCDNCAGKGIISASSGDGGETHTFCVQCNGSGKFRKVIYR